MQKNTNELLLRHSLKAERLRYKFITEFNVVSKDIIKELLLYSQTGCEDNILRAFKIMNVEMNQLIIDFIRQNGFFD